MSFFGTRRPLAPCLAAIIPTLEQARCRADIVDGKPVPSLVYRHDRHVIGVTIVPKATEAPAGEDRRDGSTIERWNAGDFTCWAVSDVNARDLRGFVEMFRGRIAQES